MSLRTYETRRFRLESGVVLENVRQAYTLHGRVNGQGDNVVVLFHSLTGTAEPTDWWPGFVGEGLIIDTRRYAVLTVNLAGSCYGTSRLPDGVHATTRDMARLVADVLQHVGGRAVALAAGGSLGGMVALEWAATFPHLSRAVIAFAAPAAHTAHAIGLNHVQRRALHLGGEPGLALARMVAMLSYRTAGELEERFGRDLRDDGSFEITSWLDHHGHRLVERFDAAAYATLLDAMDSHDVGRGRGGVRAALRACQGTLLGVGIPGDQLYPPDDVRRWVDAAGGHYREIQSVHGHDAFLLEPSQVGDILEEALHPGSVNTLAEVAS